MTKVFRIGLTITFALGAAWALRSQDFDTPPTAPPPAPRFAPRARPVVARGWLGQATPAPAPHISGRVRPVTPEPPEPPEPIDGVIEGVPGGIAGGVVGGLLCFGESRERPIVASGIWSGQLATPVVIAISAHEKISGGIGGKSWSCDQHRQQKRERFHAGLCY